MAELPIAYMYQGIFSYLRKHSLSRLSHCSANYFFISSLLLVGSNCIKLLVRNLSQSHPEALSHLSSPYPSKSIPWISVLLLSVCLFSHGFPEFMTLFSPSSTVRPEWALEPWTQILLLRHLIAFPLHTIKSKFLAVMLTGLKSKCMW